MYSDSGLNFFSESLNVNPFQFAWLNSLSSVLISDSHGRPEAGLPKTYLDEIEISAPAFPIRISGEASASTKSLGAANSST